MISATSARSDRNHGPLKKVLIGAGVLLLVIVAGLGVLVLATEAQRREDRNLTITGVDFSEIPDGAYRGGYQGWNQFVVIVTVSGGRVTAIDVADDSRDPSSEVTTGVFERVIDEQSLELDAVSGATITTNALLKSVEQALVERRAE